MSRLIDADKLLQDLQALDGQDLYLPAHFEGLIEEQPTAYDLERVVEQLEEKKAIAVNAFQTHKSESEFNRGRIIGMIKAITIVEKGGVKDEQID